VARGGDQREGQGEKGDEVNSGGLHKFRFVNHDYSLKTKFRQSLDQ